MMRFFGTVLIVLALVYPAFALNSDDFAKKIDEAMNVASAKTVDEFEGKCPLCVAEGRKSRVVVLDFVITKLDCGSGYYDEEGFFQAPYPCHTMTTYFKCSNGHYFKDIEP